MHTQHPPRDLSFLHLVDLDDTTALRGLSMRIPFPDPERLNRQREQRARAERFAQAVADDAAMSQIARQAASIKSARLDGEQRGTVAGWRMGLRHGLFAGCLLGVILGVATVRLALTGSLL